MIPLPFIDNKFTEQYDPLSKRSLKKKYKKDGINKL